MSDRKGWEERLAALPQGDAEEVGRFHDYLAAVKEVRRLREMVADLNEEVEELHYQNEEMVGREHSDALVELREWMVVCSDNNGRSYEINPMGVYLSDPTAVVYACPCTTHDYPRHNCHDDIRARYPDAEEVHVVYCGGWDYNAPVSDCIFEALKCWAAIRPAAKSPEEDES